MRMFFSASAGACLTALVLAGACARQQAPTQPPADPPQYFPTATVKDLMLSVVDPSADVVWLAVTTVQSEKGTVETMPRNDEEWTKVRHGAITLTEAANLLMVSGRHVARPGEKSETPGVELEPEEMEVLIAKDPAAWHKRVKALHDAGVAALQAIDAKDAQKLFEIGEQIEHACEGCHSQYWYPNEKIPLPPLPPPQ